MIAREFPAYSNACSGRIGAQQKAASAGASTPGVPRPNPLEGGAVIQHIESAGTDTRAVL